MHFHFAAISKVTFEHLEGETTSRVVDCSIRLIPSNNLNKGKYVENEEPITKEGMLMATTTMIMGLVTSIKLGASKGWRNADEHLEYIIDNLRKAASVKGADPHKSIMEY